MWFIFVLFGFFSLFLAQLVRKCGDGPYNYGAAAVYPNLDYTFSMINNKSFITMGAKTCDDRGYSALGELDTTLYLDDDLDLLNGYIQSDTDYCQHGGKVSWNTSDFAQNQPMYITIKNTDTDGYISAVAFFDFPCVPVPILDGKGISCDYTTQNAIDPNTGYINSIAIDGTYDKYIFTTCGFSSMENTVYVDDDNDLSNGYIASDTDACTNGGSVTFYSDDFNIGDEVFLTVYNNDDIYGYVIYELICENTPNYTYLTNNVPVSASALSGELYYLFDVPASAKRVIITTNGGSGDGDLYVRFGEDPNPVEFDCRSFENGNNETCNITAQAGTYHIMVEVFYSFSDLILTAIYTPIVDVPEYINLTNNVPVVASAAISEELNYRFNVPSSANRVIIRTNGGSGDADVYVRFGEDPNIFQFDCRSTAEGNNETCNITAQAGTYHIMVRAYASFSDVILTAVYTSIVSTPICNVTDNNFRVNWDIELYDENPNVEEVITNLSSRQVSSGNEIFEVEIEARGDYVLRGDYPSLNVYDFGVTYVLSNEQFEDNGRLLEDASDCENRYSSDMALSAINNGIGSFWTYSDQPFTYTDFPGSNGVGMQYPISDWLLNTIDDTCENGIKWNRNFTFNQLIDSCNFTWTQDTNSIYLSGYFYLTLVSPNPVIYSSSSNYNALTTDPGEYLTKQLESLEIVIEFPKSLSLINSGSVVLFGSFIISSDFNRDTEIFEITLLTYVPRYLKIIDIIGIDIGGSDGSLTWNVIQDGSDCLVQDDYRCWQKFVASRTVNNCQNENTQILDNTIELFANLDCSNSSANLNPLSSCNEFKGIIDVQQTNNLGLEQIAFSYTESCDDSLYSVVFDGELTFWDQTFSSQISEPYPSNGPTVYMQVEIFGTSDYNVIGISIESALLCTIDVLDPSTVTATSCSDSGIRDNSLWYDLFNENFNNIRDNSPDETDNIEQFSFTLPLIADNTFFVDLTVLLTLNNGQTRRLNSKQLLQNNDVNRYTNVFAGSSVNFDNDSSNNNNNKNNNKNDLFIYLIIGCSVLVLILIIVFIIFFIKYKKMQKSTKKNQIGQINITKIRTTSMNQEIESNSATPTIGSTPVGDDNTTFAKFEPTTI